MLYWHFFKGGRAFTSTQEVTLHQDDVKNLAQRFASHETWHHNMKNGRQHKQMGLIGPPGKMGRTPSSSGSLIHYGDHLPNIQAIEVSITNPHKAHKLVYQSRFYSEWCRILGTGSGTFTIVTFTQTSQGSTRICKTSINNPTYRCAFEFRLITVEKALWPLTLWCHVSKPYILQGVERVFPHVPFHRPHNEKFLWSSHITTCPLTVIHILELLRASISYSKTLLQKANFLDVRQCSHA